MHKRNFKCSFTRPRAQSGLTTLLVSVVMLFLGIVLVMTVSRTMITEQRMSANEVRHRQAFEAAQAGLDRAMIFLTAAPQGLDKNNDDVFNATDLTAGGFTLAENLPNGSKRQVAFCQSGTALPTCPDAPGALACTAPSPNNFNSPVIVSCGWSDDDMARKFITQNVGTVATIFNAPTNPLTALGAMNVGGSANVVNYFNNLTVWTGGALSSIGNSGKTFIRNPLVPPPPLGTVPPGEPNACSTSADYVCVTDKNTTGPDVIDNDPTLSNLSPGQLFENYFSKPIADYETDLPPSQVLNPADLSALTNARAKSFLIKGNTTFPNSTVGTRERPVVIVVDGNVTFQGSPTIYGIVYVTGDVSGGGTPTIFGGMVIEGDVAPTGSVDIIYDPFVTSNAATGTGVPGLIPGTWRDWR
jgi:Tfp pilus assembly protein PilX